MATELRAKFTETPDGTLRFTTNPPDVRQWFATLPAASLIEIRVKLLGIVADTYRL